MWFCTKLSKERANLERARDARAGNLTSTAKSFLTLCREYDSLVKTHVAETGCTSSH